MVSVEVFRFSEILKVKSTNPDLEKGCIVDTSILFAVSFPNDAHNTVASELFEYMRELKDTCHEVGINELTLRGSDAKVWMTGPIDWGDVYTIIGNYGIGSFDAMIINLFLNSHFPALITADKEIARTIQDKKSTGKFVFVPDRMTL